MMRKLDLVQNGQDSQAGLLDGLLLGEVVLQNLLVMFHGKL